VRVAGKVGCPNEVLALGLRKGQTQHFKTLKRKKKGLTVSTSTFLLFIKIIISHRLW